jgi:ribonuclease R
MSPDTDADSFAPHTAGDSFVGVLARRGRFVVAEPLFERGRRVTVDLRRGADVALGSMALISSGRGRGREARPRVVRPLGRPDTARDVVEALLVERGHARRFSEQLERSAREAPQAADEGRRRDLTSLATFTIDPTQARDFDDAISVEREGDGLRVSVHIADVAAHVAQGSPIDTEALRRGNSMYVPGAVEPMLPRALSSDACSLMPGVPRRAVTVEMAVNQNAEVVTVSFGRSLIRSDARLSYDEVDRIFAGEAVVPEPVAESLSLAREVARSLTTRRLGRGALGVETAEPDFDFDSEGNVVRAIDDVQTESHRLIEELMILANEQVAQELTRRRRPLIYRVHEQPEPEAIKFLVAQLESLDIPTPPIPDHITGRAAAELIGAIGAKVMEHVRRTGHGRAALTSLVLRSLKQAFYSNLNLGHAGLASAAYCHFTSPIRRYPDLVVHRALLGAIGEAEDPPSAQGLGEIAEQCSQTEREAMTVERDADDICLTFLLQRRLHERGWEEEFEAEVSGVIAGGAFLSFPVDGEGAAACDGFLPARLLRGDYYDLNEERTALVGRRTGRRLRLGDPILVTVKSVEAPRGRVDVVPVEWGERP